MYLLSFTAMIAACLIGAWHTRPAAAAMLTYAAAGFGMVAMLYLLNRPQWFLKSRRGVVHPAAWLLYWPYFIANAAVFYLQRIFWPEPPAHEIVPGLFLGQKLTAYEAARFTPTPAGVVDLTAEFSENSIFRSSDDYLLLATLDGTAPTKEQFDLGVEHIRRCLAAGAVYVHCALGHGRGPTIVAAYLLAEGKAATASEALELIRRHRKTIRLRTNQIRALEGYVEMLHRTLRS
ncbi:MAG: dual specificity protein phosphatase family protein [Planctomycetaceae bacterium]|nr:dual specificity protein phosphatase family protein [Planctomycetaceae bacterium]